MFSLFKKVSIKGTSVLCLHQRLEFETIDALHLCLPPAGQNLPFIQYIATLAIVQAVQQLAQKRLRVPACAANLALMAAITVKQPSTPLQQMACRVAVLMSGSNGQMTSTVMA